MAPEGSFSERSGDVNNKLNQVVLTLTTGKEVKQKVLLKVVVS